MKRLSPSGTAHRLRFVGIVIRVAIFVMLAFHAPRLQFAQSAPDPQLPIFPGGFVEKTNSTGVRPLLTAAQIQSLLPGRGAFVFPSPYNTQAVRITNGTDCGGSDCLESVGYSYWRNMNNSAASDTMLIFLGLNRARGGAGPTLFSYNKVTDVVSVVGPLFDAASPFSWATAEGWYFSATLPTALYLPSGSSLMRYDVVSHQMRTVFDAAPLYGGDKYIWQVHSSNDDRVHSATLRSSATYEMLGCLAYREDTQQFSYFPKSGDLDECQIDKSGRWLVIKENVDGLYGEDNRIIDLQTGVEKVLLDQNGAAGHSDNGYGVMVYSDNWNSLPNAIRVFEFGTDQLRAPLVYHNMDWSVAAPGHVSYANAKAGTPFAQQYACGSGTNRINSNRANEIICFRLDTSLDVLVVAPVMTSLDASGGGSDDYSKLPKGNLDPTGQYLIWTSNMGGSRQDAFVVKIPSQLLVSSSSGDTTPPVLSAVSVSQVTSGGASLSWTSSEASDSQVEYGTTTAYGSVTSLDPALMLSHTRTPSGLAASTLYHGRARSRDAAGNLAVSGDFTFTTTAVTPPPPSTSPVGYWMLDEASGSLAADSSGNGDTGTLLNGPLHVPGRLGMALSFNGVDQSVSVPHATVLDAYPLTVSFWVSTTTSALGGMVNKYFPGSLSGYQVFTSGGSLCAWYFKDASNYVWDGGGCTLATTGFNDGQWHHVAFIVDASGGRLFVDGTQRASQPWTGTPGATITTQGLSLAQYPGTALPFLPGRLDDVRIYNRALSASDVSSLFNVAPVLDTTPPLISLVSAAGLSSGATIKWTTSEPGDSQVDYGTTTAYGSLSSLDPTLVLSHTQTPSGLAAGTLYHYRVRSRDAAGNLAVSGDSTFTTLAPAPNLDTTPPVISLVSAAGLSSGATIKWTTSEPGDSQVDYGTTTAYGSLSSLDPTLVLSHTQTPSGLAAGTLYHYRVHSRDAAGNLAVSGDSTFTTLAPAPVLDTTPPVISRVSSMKVPSGGEVVRWTTNEPSDSRVEYGTTTAYGSTTTLNASLVLSHSQTLSALMPYITYHFRVRSRDKAGNLAVSGDFTFKNVR